MAQILIKLRHFEVCPFGLVELEDLFSLFFVHVLYLIKVSKQENSLESSKI